MNLWPRNLNARILAGKLLSLAVLCLPVAAAAQDVQPGQDAPEDPPAQEDQESYLDVTHRYISERFLYLPNSIDSFFGDARIIEETNQSRLRLTFDIKLSEGNEWSYVSNLNAKVVLPNTEKRLRLVIESTPEDAAAPEEEGANQASPVDAVKKTDQTAAIQATIKEGRFWQFNATSGIKFHTPIDPFIRLRARRNYIFKQWQLRATQTVFWFDSIGLGETTQLDFELPFNTDKLFRATTIATWHREDEDLNWSQTFSVFNWLTNKRAVSYNAAVIGSSEPNYHVTDYVLDVRYRQRVLRDWMFFELRPELHYPEEENFHLTPSLNFRFQAIFGELPQKEK